MEKKIDTDRMNSPFFLMVLRGIGDYAYQRKDGIYVIPIGCLKYCLRRYLSLLAYGFISFRLSIVERNNSFFHSFMLSLSLMKLDTSSFADS